MEKFTKAEKKELRKQEWQAKLNTQQRDEKIKKYGIWAIVGLVTLAVVFIFYKAGTSTSTPVEQLIKIPPVTKSDISTGPANSKAVLVEYSDFQCPSCAASYPLVKQLLVDFKGKIRYAYRFFPLTGVHQNAMASAQAGYAAYKQDKFWEMEDAFFTHQTDWAELSDPQPLFVSYATKIGMNIDQFKADVVSSETNKFITDEMNSGLSIGINSTPTFFLNGNMISPNGYDDFKNQIQKALSSK